MSHQLAAAGVIRLRGLDDRAPDCELGVAVAAGRVVDHHALGVEPRRSGCRTSRVAGAPRGAADDAGLRHACRGRRRERGRRRDGRHGAGIDRGELHASAVQRPRWRSLAPTLRRPRSTQIGSVPGVPCSDGSMSSSVHAVHVPPVRHLAWTGVFQHQAALPGDTQHREGLELDLGKLSHDGVRGRRDVDVIGLVAVGLVVVQLSNRRGRDAIAAIERRNADVANSRRRSRGVLLMTLPKQETIRSQRPRTRSGGSGHG